MTDSDEASSSVTDPAPPEPFVEIDPSGRYGRYSDLLGAGAVKKVYRGFDQQEGIEVAWNQVRLSSFDKQMRDRLFAEVHILRSLRHPHIISLHSAWHSATAARNGSITNLTRIGSGIAASGANLNFITEVCVSGNLRDYRLKHRHVSLKALKNWSHQILTGLRHLHEHNPCIIHRDLNLSNIFMNGNIGEVKIGDLGLAAVVGRSHHAHSIIGTPEFMAPELYEEEYTEKIDIYSFGMCVLELVTLEIPYSECENVTKIYYKVSSGVRPKAMEKVKDDEVRGFIERCLGLPRDRPSAAELLNDPFFEGIAEEVESAPPVRGRAAAGDRGMAAVSCSIEAGISAVRI